RHGTVPEQPCRGNPALAPISLARAVLQETKSELQKMEEQQEMRNKMLEQMVTETANRLNAQVRSWGSTPTTSWLEEEQEQESGDCTGCAFNIRACLGSLLKRYEKLQEQVDSLESRHMVMGKLKRIMRNWGQCYIFSSLEQDQEQLQKIEATVVQIQGDCEKLSFDSGKLQKDSQQKQRAIEV
ncbi:QRIC2 protein, partial [Acrocephalus arundinaceus]|nr:QRIC2 protein [Acrocephalus arundinaceus]